MHRRKGEVVVGTWGQEVAEKGKLELVPEQARRLVEEVAGAGKQGVVVENCEPVAGVVVETCTWEGEEMCSSICLRRLLTASS